MATLTEMKEINDAQTLVAKVSGACADVARSILGETPGTNKTARMPFVNQVLGGKKGADGKAEEIHYHVVAYWGTEPTPGRSKVQIEGLSDADTLTAVNDYVDGKYGAA